MYKVNDAVVYSTYGVCKITAIEERDFSGENVEYYVLRPVTDTRNTFYVPTSKGDENNLRPVYTREDVDELIKAMPEYEFIWIESRLERKDAYKKIIEKGDHVDLIKLIKALYIRSQTLAASNRKLNSTDERFLREAENLLYDEFAYALEIPRSEVVPYIKAHVYK